MSTPKDDVSLGSYEHYYKNLPAQYSGVPGVVNVPLKSSQSLTNYLQEIPHFQEPRSQKLPRKSAVRSVSCDMRRAQKLNSSSASQPSASSSATAQSEAAVLVKDTPSVGISLSVSFLEDSVAGTEDLTTSYMEDPTVTSHSSPRTMMSNPQAGRSVSAHSHRSLQIISPTVSPAKPLMTLFDPMTETDTGSLANSLYDDSLETGSLPDVLTDHIQVAVRLRPLQTQELLPKRSLMQRSNINIRSPKVKKDSRVWSHQDATISQKQSHRQVSGRNVFTFDRVFGENTSSQVVYEKFGAPIVRAVLTGRNGTLFAYGQTGSGKTHTMQGTTADEGIIPRAARDLFAQAGPHARVTAQYFEIYNEVVRDLVADNHATNLAPASTSSRQSNGATTLPVLQVHETFTGIEVNGHTHMVRNVKEVLKLLERGQLNRTSACTDANAQSSRSHAIFRLKVERRTSCETLTSNLNLVDLAGSENAHRSGTTGARKREGAKINQSLLSLSRVIHSLSLPDKKRPKHIGYRDSKLTRILQPSLEGNACTAILCCASASRLHLEETRSTFKFASSAKRITVRPMINQVSNPKTQIASLQRELEETRRALLHMQEQMNLNASISRLNTEVTTLRPAMRTVSPPVSPMADPEPRMIIESIEVATNSNSHNLIAPKLSSDEQSLSTDQVFRISPEQPSLSPSALSTVGPSERDVRPCVQGVYTDDEEKQEMIALENSSIVSETRSDAVLFDDSGLSSAFMRQQESSRSIVFQQQVTASQAMSARSGPSEYSLQATPPVSEVVIMTSSPEQKNASPEAKLVDAEERAKFLAGKLEATDSLVETLFEDLKHARRQNEDLVSLKDNIEGRLQYLEEAKEVKNEDNEILMQQHLLLKYAIYVGLGVYLCGWKEYFLAVIVFMWLSLEIVT